MKTSKNIEMLTILSPKPSGKVDQCTTASFCCQAFLITTIKKSNQDGKLAKTDYLVLLHWKTPRNSRIWMQWMRDAGICNYQSQQQRVCN